MRLFGAEIRIFGIRVHDTFTQFSVRNDVSVARTLLKSYAISQTQTFSYGQFSRTDWTKTNTDRLFRLTGSFLD